MSKAGTNTKSRPKGKVLPYLITAMFVLALIHFTSKYYKKQLAYLFSTTNQKFLAASVINKTDVMKEMLANGADINYHDIRGWTALHFAAHENFADQIRFLKENGADMNPATKEKWTPLHWAVYQKSYKAVEALLNAGAKVDCKNHMGNSPLHLAAFNEDIECCKLLLDSGTDVNIQNYSGSTPLDFAVHQKSIHMAKFFLSQDADPNSLRKTGCMKHDSTTPIGRAAFFGQVNMMSLLMAHNATLNIKDNWGNTPLHEAARKNHLYAVIYLLDNGSDPYCKNNRGKTAGELSSSKTIKKVIFEKMQSLVLSNGNGNYRHIIFPAPFQRQL